MYNIHIQDSMSITPLQNILSTMEDYINSPLYPNVSPVRLPPKKFINGTSTTYISYIKHINKDNHTAYYKRITVMPNKSFEIKHRQEQRKQAQQEEETKKKIIKKELNQILINNYNLHEVLKIKTLMESGQMNKLIQTV